MNDMGRPRVKEKKDVIVMVRKSTQNRLSNFGHGVGRTFDDVIIELMDFYDEHMCEHLHMKTDCPICQNHFINHIAKKNNSITAKSKK